MKFFLLAFFLILNLCEAADDDCQIVRKQKITIVNPRNFPELKYLYHEKDDTVKVVTADIRGIYDLYHNTYQNPELMRLEGEIAINPLLYLPQIKERNFSGIRCIFLNDIAVGNFVLDEYSSHIELKIMLAEFYKSPDCLHIAIKALETILNAEEFELFSWKFTIHPSIKYTVQILESCGFKKSARSSAFISVYEHAGS